MEARRLPVTELQQLTPVGRSSGVGGRRTSATKMEQTAAGDSERASRHSPSAEIKKGPDVKSSR